jgi:hypothetical protein
MSKLPVLHFRDEEALTKFTTSLGADENGSYKLSDFGIESEGISSQYMSIFQTSNEKSFGCVTKIPIAQSMCDSSAMYNFVFQSLKMDYELLLSIIPDKPFTSGHSNVCRVAKDTLDILNYLSIEVKDIKHPDDFKFASTPLSTFVQMIRLPMVFQGDDDDDDDFGVVEPKQKQVHVDDSWTKTLKPEKELEKITENNENLGCVACCTYKKSITMSCGHINYCDLCFKKMMESTRITKTCPTCKEDFKYIIRTYL